MSKKIFYIISFLLVTAITICTYALVTRPEDKALPSIKHEKIQIQPNNCSAKSGEVNIALITDSRYAPPTAVAIASAIMNKCPNSTYNFYIIAENITEQDYHYLLRLKSLSPKTVNITIIPRQPPELPFENMERFLQYKVGMHKIYLPEILKDVDKVIYMDGDTLTLKDLRPLYEMDIKNEYAAVAKDGIYYRFPKEMAEMGLDKRGFYFNSGVMLQNLKLQRQDNITNKLVEYIKTHNDFFGDQDVLNVVFGNKLKLMSYRYNCISTFFEADDLAFLSSFFQEKLPEKTFNIYENASIIHYAGDKPWQENYRPLFLKELWFRYYDMVKEY